MAISEVENKQRTYEGKVTAEEEWLAARFLFSNSKWLALSHVKCLKS